MLSGFHINNNEENWLTIKVYGLEFFTRCLLI